MRGAQFAHMAIDRSRRRDVTVSPIIVDCRDVDVPRNAGMAKQRMKLGGENKLVVGQQRLQLGAAVLVPGIEESVVPSTSCPFAPPSALPITTIVTTPC